MSLKIVIFEDNPENAKEFLASVGRQLTGKGVIKLFTPPKTATYDGTYEDRLTKDLQLPDYENPTLIVADRDLSRTDTYGGMSESVVKRVADSLGMPECAYSRGEQAENFLMSANQREARIGLSLGDGIDKFAQQVVSIAEGFVSITEKLKIALTEPGKKSPGTLLASILGKPEYADKIALYASGDQNRLASVLKLRGVNDTEKVRPLTCLLGYWLWDSVLRFPGIVVNEVAASSYLNIKEEVFKTDPAIQGNFSEARYQGPFAGAKGPMWWRGILDDIVAKSGCADGREFTEQRLQRSILRSECCEDPSKPAGYYCMLSNKPVSLENSKGGLTWFPRGADLARVSSTKYAELAPWL